MLVEAGAPDRYMTSRLRPSWPHTTCVPTRCVSTFCTSEFANHEGSYGTVSRPKACSWFWGEIDGGAAHEKPGPVLEMA